MRRPYKKITLLPIFSVLVTTGFLNSIHLEASDFSAWSRSDSCLVQTVGELIQDPPPMKINFFWWVGAPDWTWPVVAPLNLLAFGAEQIYRWGSAPSNWKQMADRTAVLNLINEAYEDQAYERIYIPFLRFESPLKDQFSNSWVLDREEFARTLRQHERKIKREDPSISPRISTLAGDLSLPKKTVKEWLRQSEARGILCAGGEVLLVQEWMALAHSGLLQEMIESSYYYGKMRQPSSEEASLLGFNSIHDFETNFPYPVDGPTEGGHEIFNRWAWSDAKASNLRPQPESSEGGPNQADIDSILEILGDVMGKKNKKVSPKNTFNGKGGDQTPHGINAEGTRPNDDTQTALQSIRAIAQLVQHGKLNQAQEELGKVHHALDDFRDWRMRRP